MLGDIMELAQLQWKLVWLSLGEAKQSIVYGLTAVAMAIAFGILVLVSLMLCGVYALHEYGELGLTASYGIACGVAVLGLVITSYTAYALINKASAMLAATVAECEENGNWLRQSLFEEEEPVDQGPTDYQPAELNRTMYGLPPR
jgi:uncharacterized membrane protein YqjE